MKLKGDKFFLQNYRNCPRLSVFSCNQNTYNSKRLPKAPLTPSQFSENVLNGAFFKILEDFKKGKTISKKDKEIIFVASKNVELKRLNTEKYKKIDVTKYEEKLLESYKAFMYFMSKIYIKPSMFNEYYEKNVNISFNIGKIIEQVFKKTLDGEYSLDVHIPFIHGIDNYYYVKMFIHKNKTEYLKADERINLIFLLFDVLKLQLKEIKVYDVSNMSVSSFHKPPISQHLFLYDLKTIFFCIDKKLYKRRYSTETCGFCCYHNICFKKMEFFVNKKITPIKNFNFTTEYKTRNKINKLI